MIMLFQNSLGSLGLSSITFSKTGAGNLQPFYPVFGDGELLWDLIGGGTAQQGEAMVVALWSATVAVAAVAT